MKKIGVVIPACNEEAYIERCLLALKSAQTYFFQYFKTIENLPEIQILVVLDHCTDSTAAKVQQMNISAISCDFRNVGKARHLGIQQMIEQGCDWICCTDADSFVQCDWFQMMLQHQPTDAICGVVELDQWDHLSRKTRQAYLRHYQDSMGHRHVHGANLCFKASAYIQVNGFQQLDCHEDVDFIRRLEKADAQIVWSNQLRVTTSSRLSSKIAAGFAHFLQKLELKQAAKKPISLCK
ncbi:glycosyltransferase [Acinetobacter sp.]|uniref:glycosyltransferase n=1 Tax=Acinetobacter sp. TaxID=472 RepID=UPI00289A7D32|nr:glycosyltransferase [Acinetobacter sp.]